MKRKVSLLSLAFLLAFSPAVAFAAENEKSVGNENVEQKATVQDVSNVVTNEGAKEEQANSEVQETASDVKNNVPTEETSKKEEVAPTVEGEEKVDEATKHEQTTTNKEDAATEEANPVSKQEEAESGVEDEGEISEDNTANENTNDEETNDDDLNLDNIYGTASGKIQYDWNKGYFVLKLQAGLGNFSSKPIKQKWVAFALPDGVYVPDVADVPAGIVPVKLYDGHNGIAVKVPDVKGHEHQFVYLDIPLVGEIDKDYNSPNKNLYLFNIDIKNGTAEDLGQIGAQREIDFSVMNDTPEIQVEGAVSGSAVYNREKHYYEIGLNVKVTNDSEQELTDEYIGFELPEGVRVLKGNDDVKLLKQDGKDILAVHFPTIKKGENVVKTTVPIIGKTNGEVSNKGLTLYRMNDTYQIIGQIEGEANIDYSAMNKSWIFNGESQLVRDFPGLPKNQFGMRFAFEVQNLTLADVEKVKVEFLVPDDIKVHAPDGYKIGDLPDSLKDFLSEDFSGVGGNLDIEWKGNTATINLDTIEATEWNQGYFTAIGESSKALDKLKGLDVKITLYQDGNKVVDVIHVPFSVVPYEGPGDDQDKGNDGDNDKNQTPGTDKEEPNDENKTGHDDKNKDNQTPAIDDGGSKGEDPTNNTDWNKNNQGGTDGNGNSSNGTNKSSSTVLSDGQLPKTGSFFNNWFYLMVGAIMLVTGGFIYRRSRMAQ